MDCEQIVYIQNEIQTAQILECNSKFRKVMILKLW